MQSSKFFIKKHSLLAVLFTAVLTVLNTLNFLFSSEPLFPFVIWGAGAVFLICSAVFYSKSCKNVKRMIDLLNKAGTYKDIADALFTGFLHFGTSMPRGYSKEFRMYAKGFKDFARTELEQNGSLTEEEFSELIRLQKIVRTKNLFESLLIAAAAAWFLILPAAVILMLKELM
ncbi:hypothetical protein H0R92_13745 [Treponema sp. OMZ 840]|uniref:hypothetical protein n=1 Tax=Treponema sp. OMZ 840 TaxID=244313 RepID=UPI003D8BCCCB